MSLHHALQEFGRELTANFAVAELNPAQAEDQLKGPTQRLLDSTGAAFGLDVVARSEARTNLGVRPDLGVSVATLLAGHVELKAPGKGVRRAGFTTAHDREQFDRLKHHPNLLYTDGNQWALYRNGRLVGKIVSAGGDIRTDGDATYSEADAADLEAVFRDFLTWEPIVPTTPRALAGLLAPLTRLLRETVQSALADPASALSQLAGEWRNVFFPDATDEQFADAYAQTVTYALLLARVEGETDLHARAADRLDERHGLLAQVLRVLADPAARDEVESAVDLLERAISAVDPGELARRTRKQDLWLYFYEDFLAEYDPALRRQRGVYFTPAQVVHAQTAFVAQLLRERFGKDSEFADDGVTVLDPAVGTGTYLLAAFQRGLDRVRELFGPGATPGRASIMADQFHGFEILIGPYAVAHLRVAQQIVEARGELPTDGAHVYLTDTLESPHLAPPGLAHAPLFQRKLAEENERARKIKAEAPIVVCLGNPPYSRHEAGEVGGWVRHGDEGDDGILRDFLSDAPAVHVKNLYNLYVYFWRWALWKVFENPPGRGIVSFVTASSYLRGPGFVGMRRFMRETFDELWILDLGGDNLGARKSENVFAIQNAVAIAIGVRSGGSDASQPASVRYARIEGTREAKLAALFGIDSLSDVEWSDCFSDWQQPFLPASEGDYFAWPLLTDMFPWQHSGVQFKRTWPIAPARDALASRWERLVASRKDERAALFHETRDRGIGRTYKPLLDGEPIPAISELTQEAPVPPIVPYSYRSLDRQYCLAESRVGDFCGRRCGAPWGLASSS